MRKLPISIQTFEDVIADKYYEPFLTSDKKVILLGLGFLNKEVHGRMKYL